MSQVVRALDRELVFHHCTAIVIHYIRQAQGLASHIPQASIVEHRATSQRQPMTLRCMHNNRGKATLHRQAILFSTANKITTMLGQLLTSRHPHITNYNLRLHLNRSLSLLHSKVVTMLLQHQQPDRESIISASSLQMRSWNTIHLHTIPHVCLSA